MVSSYMQTNSAWATRIHTGTQHQHQVNFYNPKTRKNSSPIELFLSKFYLQLALYKTSLLNPMCQLLINMIMTQTSHLGHAIANNASDKLDVLSCRGSFIGQVNNVICRFSKLDEDEDEATEGVLFQLLWL